MSDAMRAGREAKALAKVYNFGEYGIMSMGAFFGAHPPVSKAWRAREYADRKENGEYKKLDHPKMEYFLSYTRDNGLMVPKLVYDLFDVPEHETH